MLEHAEPNKITTKYVETDAPPDWQHRETMQFPYKTFDFAGVAFFSSKDEPSRCSHRMTGKRTEAWRQRGRG